MRRRQQAAGMAFEIRDLQEDYGRLLAMFPDEQVAAPGKGRRWHGRPGLPRLGDYTTAYLPRVLERLERLAPLRPVDALRDDLRRAAAKHGTSSYALLHGRVNAGNVLVDGASAIWIDLGSAHYGEPARGSPWTFEAATKQTV